ncbi:MAG: ATP-binding protein [Anaerolineae bacterium]|nr:ATP-binding protein [Anaerolineae bacterium]
MAEIHNTILIICAAVEERNQIISVVASLHATPLVALDPPQALTMLKSHHVDIIILDLDSENAASNSQVMQDRQYEIVQGIRNTESTAELPIIFLSRQSPDTLRLQLCASAGPVAFLSKPFSPFILELELMNFIQRLHYQSEYRRLADESTLLKLDLSRRNKQLAFSSQVARRISIILDQDLLLREIIRLIQEEFKFYFTGIWLLSANSESIVLREGSFSKENAALKPGYILNLGEDSSIISHVCRTQHIHIAQNTNQDPYYLAADALPETKAELTIPLTFKGGLLGVIDIQSERPQVFHPDDIEILGTIADQVAVAIRNANLYNEVLKGQEKLEEMVLNRTQELQAAYQKLELLEQNKSDFIQVLSHELRTPLTLVSGYAELLLTNEQGQTDPFFKQQVMGVLTGSIRLHELIDSMVDMLKIDSRSLQLMPQKISLDGIIAPLLATLEEALQRRNIKVTSNNLENLPEIEGDLALLEKVFDQLVTNAMKYTPDGGEISIQGRHIHQDFNGVAEDFIEISVRDTGIGISPEHLDMIFTKFYQIGNVSQHSTGKIKFKGGGPGLGLSISRGIVEAHRGRIWAESPGHDENICPGSCFYVLLPVSQELY